MNFFYRTCLSRKSSRCTTKFNFISLEDHCNRITVLQHIINLINNLHLVFGISKRVMLLHLLYQPHRLGFQLVLRLTSLYTARTKATLLRKYSNIVFMNSVMISRITIAYLLMALKKVTELLLLLSIETTPNVFDYLMQQAFSEMNYMPFCLRQMSSGAQKKRIF